MEKYVWVDLNSPPGTKIKYLGESDEFLKNGETYTVQTIDTAMSEILVELEEIPNEFFDLGDFVQKITYNT